MFQSHAQQVRAPPPPSERCENRFVKASSSGFPFQALDWLQQSGDHYLSTHTSPGATVTETQELLNQHREFCVSAKVRWPKYAGCCVSGCVARLTLCSSAHPGEGPPLDPTG